MKVLLSAYACKPNTGSEPGVGWHWAMEIARLRHEVWVLTRANNKPAIDAELAAIAELPSIHFIFYDLPLWARFWKKGSRGIHLYYLLWQWGAYRTSRVWHQRVHFDRVHHVTFVSIRQPSFLGNLGVPFIFGPAGGGERAPWRLRLGFSTRAWLTSVLRDASNFFVRSDPLMRRAFRQAERIYVTSNETLALLPRHCRPKATIQIAVGTEDSSAATLSGTRYRPRSNGSSLRVLYIGRMLCLKGMHLGLAAFARLLRSWPNARLTMVGRGPAEKRWRRLADRLGIGSNVDWLPWMDRDELPAIYRDHDILLFPSLHDTGGMVVLEALSHGLPVVCLDLGGPGVMVNKSCGHVVKTHDRSAAAVVEALADALLAMATDSSRRERLSAGAMERARELSWRRTVSAIYQPAATNGTPAAPG